MSDSKHDSNYIHTALASDGTATGTEPLRVDPVTSRLLLDITAVSENGITGTFEGKRDNNFIPASYAVTDDANQNVTPLRIDARNNLLFLDILVE